MKDFKFSKRQFFQAVISGTMTFTDGENVVTISDEEAKAFAQHEIDLLDSRAAKAKETKAKKAAEPDALADAVLEALTDKFQTASDIATAINSEDATVNKVMFRLNTLVDAGLATKDDIKVGKNTRKGFKRA